MVSCIDCDVYEYLDEFIMHMGELLLDSSRFLKGIRVGPTSYVRIHLGFHRGIRVGIITHCGIRLEFYMGVGAGPVSLVSEHGYRFCRLIHDAYMFIALLSDIMTFLYTSACVDVANLARDLLQIWVSPYNQRE